MSYVEKKKKKKHANRLDSREDLPSRRTSNLYLSISKVTFLLRRFSRAFRFNERSLPHGGACQPSKSSLEILASQDSILSKERVDDYPKNQRDDHRDKEDGFEEVPRALHPRFRAACPTLAAAVPAWDGPWLHGGRGRDGARRQRHFHLA